MPEQKPLLRRTDLLDTSEWAHAEMLRRLRAMTSQERVRIAMDRSASARLIRVHTTPCRNGKP